MGKLTSSNNKNYVNNLIVDFIYTLSIFYFK